MALSILNNISALTAQNQMSVTQANLQKTLTQLSSGLKINTGADDAAGLSIANGLTANIAALTQSQQNASNGIGLLQTADGALSQVTALLNRAVTLATEASNSTLNGASGSQATALNTEFQKILTTINTIGSTTNFNGSAVFGAGPLSIAMSDGTTSGDMTVKPTVGALTTVGIGLGASEQYASAKLSGTAAAVAGDSVVVGGKTYTFIANGAAATSTNDGEVEIGANLAESLKNLADAINLTAGGKYSKGTSANGNVGATAITASSITIQAKSTTLSGALLNVSTGYAGAAHGLAFTDGATGLTGGVVAGNDLLNTTNASNALTALTSAIKNVAAQRGTVGAAINQLQSASAIMNTQVQNLSSAQNAVMNADIGKTVADMTQYNILQSTGMSALQQANQAQQSVLKLLQ